MINYEKFKEVLPENQLIKTFKTVQDFKNFLQPTEQEWKHIETFAQDCSDEHTPEGIFDNCIQIEFEEGLFGIVEIRQIMDGEEITDSIDNIFVYEYVDEREE